jgi:hypothetical protein
MTEARTLVSQLTPDLEQWIPKPALRIAHRRQSAASATELWEAAEAIRVCDTALLGRLIRWRIPGTGARQRFSELFASPPFLVLERGETSLVSGLVGRIWTLRRDYPRLEDPEEFRGWAVRGTARVVFANWAADGALHSEARVEAFGSQGRLGLAAVRPLVSAFQHLIGSEGIQAAVRRAEGGTTP